MAHWSRVGAVAVLLTGACDTAPWSHDEPCADACDSAYAAEIGTDDEIWVFVQSHLHTSGNHERGHEPANESLPGYDPEGVRAILAEGLDFGATDMIFTDHNNIDAWFDEAFVPMANEELTHFTTPLRGIEWTAKNGHLNLFLPRASVSSSSEAIEAGLIHEHGAGEPTESSEVFSEAIAASHSHGGLAVINHPHSLIFGFQESAMGADAAEVGVPLNLAKRPSAGARAWWQRRLFSGDRITGIAGSDHHHDDGAIKEFFAPVFGNTVNLVRLDPSMPNIDDAIYALEHPEETIDTRSDLVLDAIRRGHVMVVEDKKSPRVYIGADLDGDGDYNDARGGDCILPSDFDGEEISFRIRVTHPVPREGTGHYNALLRTANSDSIDADRAYLKTKVRYQKGFKVSEHYEIDPSDPFTITIRIPFDPDRRDFLWLQLNKDIIGPVNDMEALINPIYFGDWGEECESARPIGGF